MSLDALFAIVQKAALRYRHLSYERFCPPVFSFHIYIHIHYLYSHFPYLLSARLLSTIHFTNMFFSTSVIFADVASFSHDIYFHSSTQIYISHFTFLIKLIKLIFINSQSLYTFSFLVRHLVFVLADIFIRPLRHLLYYYIASLANSFATCNNISHYFVTSSSAIYAYYPIYIALPTSVINFLSLNLTNLYLQRYINILKGHDEYFFQVHRN